MVSYAPTLLCSITLLTAGAIGLLHEAEMKYHGAQVFRVLPTTANQLGFLRELLRDPDYDFWTEPSAKGKPVDILASNGTLSALRAALAREHLTHQVLLGDVLEHLEYHRRENEKALEKARQTGGGGMEWTAYHDYDEIMNWMVGMAATYPSLVTVEDVGQSYEGRTMKMLKVSRVGKGPKPAIFTDGGIHAREWIAPATVTYIINELLSNQQDYADVLDAVDLYFMPSINPDGYAYSWTDDRYWRKTRTPSANGVCVGTDPNRNWDFHWKESGASSMPCSETYAGPEPFSEPCAQVVRSQMLKYNASIKVYLTFHSYSQCWIYPWGYDDSLPSDWQDLDELARSAVRALTAIHGTNYEVGSSGQIMYPAAGASDDYAKGVAGIKYSYTIELRDQGKYGFNLPPEQIIPTGSETFAAFKVIMDFIMDTYGNSKRTISN